MPNSQSTLLKRIARRPAGLARQIGHRLFWKFGPRIGVLRQYKPRPVAVAIPPQPSRPAAELPHISIVTPSFNQGQFIEATIRSVLDQPYPNLDYSVQDGGSTDETVGALQAIHDDRFRWISERDNGQAHAINKGFSDVRGNIMGWINSDDVLLPGSLAAVGQYFLDHPDVDAVYGHRVLIDAAGEDIGKWIVPEHDSVAITWADYVPQETLFWRRELWDLVGGLDESFRFALDWDLLLRFEQSDARIVRLPYFLGCFRVYDEQLTSSVIGSLGAEEMQRLRQRCHGKDVTEAEIAKGLLPYFIEHLRLHYRWKLGI